MERQDGDGWFVGQRERRLGMVSRGRAGRRNDPPIRWLPLHFECLHRPLNVLEYETAQIVEAGPQPARHCVMHVAGNHNTGSGGLRLQSRGHVHAVAVQIIAINDQITQVQADTKFDARFFRLGPTGLRHGLLELDCCT
jgi:hypothetical protein